MFINCIFGFIIGFIITAKKSIQEKIFMLFLVSLLLIISLCLPACSSEKMVNVPHLVKCPSIHLPSESHYPIHDLNDKDSNDKIVKSYVATVKLQHDYIQNVKHIVNYKENKI